MIRFVNPGSIDPVMWNVMGVSVKHKDNPIGMFGTGLKYAIAVLLRENRDITITTHEGVNKKTYRFHSEPRQYRGQEFQQCMCNGKELPFTTEYGKKWELWQAYRELYSNCLDEGGNINMEVDTTLGTMLGGYTVIEAELDDINHHEVFLDRNKPLVFKGTHVEVYKGESQYIYIRGVRAGETSGGLSKYTYNLLTADLTEDRTMKYGWEFDMALCEAAKCCENKDYLWDMLYAVSENAESKCSYAWNKGIPGEPTDKIKELVVEAKRNRHSVWVNHGIIEFIEEYLDNNDKYELRDTTDKEQKILDKAKSFLGKMGYAYNYPIFISDNLGIGVLGLADRKQNRVLLSKECMDGGVKEVAATLLEEYVHLAHGLDDESRKMQDWLFNQIITLGENVTGEIL